MWRKLAVNLSRVAAAPCAVEHRPGFDQSASAARETRRGALAVCAGTALALEGGAAPTLGGKLAALPLGGASTREEMAGGPFLGTRASGAELGTAGATAGCCVVRDVSAAAAGAGSLATPALRAAAAGRALGEAGRVSRVAPTAKLAAATPIHQDQTLHRIQRQSNTEPPYYGGATRETNSSNLPPVPRGISRSK